MRVSSVEQHRLPRYEHFGFRDIRLRLCPGPGKAFDLDYRIRRAFYYESRWIHLRNTLLEIAGEAGLEMDRLTEDFDTGRYKARVMIDCNEALRKRDEEDKPMTSPTLILPNGEFYYNPFSTEKTFNEDKVMIVLKQPEKTGRRLWRGTGRILRRALT